MGSRKELTLSACVRFPMTWWTAALFIVSNVSMRTFQFFSEWVSEYVSKCTCLWFLAAAYLWAAKVLLLAHTLVKVRTYLRVRTGWNVGTFAHIYALLHALSCANIETRPTYGCVCIGSFAHLLRSAGPSSGWRSSAVSKSCRASCHLSSW